MTKLVAKIHKCWLFLPKILTAFAKIFVFEKGFSTLLYKHKSPISPGSQLHRDYNLYFECMCLCEYIGMYYISPGYGQPLLVVLIRHHCHNQLIYLQYISLTTIYRHPQRHSITSTDPKKMEKKREGERVNCSLHIGTHTLISPHCTGGLTGVPPAQAASPPPHLSPLTQACPTLLFSGESWDVTTTFITGFIIVFESPCWWILKVFSV